MRRFLLLILPAMATLTGVLIFEVGARGLVKSSDTASGALFGIDLPPLKVIAEVKIVALDPSKVWRQKGRGNPENLTIGDLWGIVREDEVLGYVPLENTRSAQGWWESNNIGARSRVRTDPEIPKGKKRIFVFGESYAHGSRVRQEDTWFRRMEVREPRAEIINLSVDGYGMGQAYLRYQGVRDKFQFDSAAFVFVPESDLWRDVNTMRYLGESWSAYTILPRYVLEEDKLKLIPGPYPIGSEIYKRDFPVLGDKVRDHLRRYDRFYIPLLYETPPFLGWFITYRLAANFIGQREKDRIYQEMKWNVGAEAMRITRRIFQAVDEDTRKRGKRFVLLLLPDPEVLAAFRAGGDPAKREIWNRRLALFRKDGVTAIDLLPELLKLSEDRIDRGYDGSHYGPKTNEAMAEIIDRRFRALGLL